MNLPKCDELYYAHFLTVAQKVFTCTEVALCLSEWKAPAYDAFTCFCKDRRQIRKRCGNGQKSGQPRTEDPAPR